MCCLLLRENTSLSLSEIADVIEYKSHATVFHSIAVSRNDIKVDVDLRMKYHTLNDKIKNFLL